MPSLVRRYPLTLTLALLTAAALPASALAALPVAGETYHTDPENFDGVYEPGDGRIDGKADVQIDVQNRSRRKIDGIFFSFKGDDAFDNNDSCARSGYNVMPRPGTVVQVSRAGRFRYAGAAHLAKGPNLPRRGSATVRGEFTTRNKAVGRVVHEFRGCRESARFTAHLLD